ncbi:hypothetical protein PENTCL1PPCAC_24340, partial [Pristionchus entomophagus]
SSFIDSSFAIMSNANNDIRSIRLAIREQIQRKREQLEADLEALRQRDQESIQRELRLMETDNLRRMVDLMH